MIRITSFVAFVVLLGLLATPAVAQQVTPIYNGSGTPDNDSWLDNRTDPTADNVTNFLTRVGTFVIGDVDGDAAAGPLFTGLLVGLLVIGLAGTTRTGLVGGGMIGVITTAVLSESAGVLPEWAYGVTVMIIGLVVGIVYIRMMR